MTVAPPPLRSDTIAVELAPYHMGWFHLRIVLHDCCARIDYDSSTGGYALEQLEEAGKRPGDDALSDPSPKPLVASIEFDDESLDTAQLEINPGPPGWSRLVIGNWCRPQQIPSLDVLVPTARLRAEIQRASAEFRRIDPLLFAPDRGSG
jgi:hypothetical protein